MEKLSKYISKKVISLDNANQIGYVLNIIFDNEVKNFEGLIVIDEESENSFVLKEKDIKVVGEDCIMIENSNCLEFNISSHTNNPIGKTVYDCQANMLGRVIDVEISGKTVKKIITNKCEFPSRFIKKSGDNFIIFGSPSKNSKKTNFRANFNEKNVENSPKVVIEKYEEVKPNIIPTQPELPIRLYAKTKLLVGRVATQDIVGYNNEIIVKKNQKINQKIIEKAILHNKLNFLNFYSN